MSADLRERLHRDAQPPTRPVDLDAIRSGARRHRRVRVATTVAGAGAGVAAGVAAVLLLTGPDPDLVPSIDPAGTTTTSPTAPSSSPSSTPAEPDASEPDPAEARVERLRQELASIAARRADAVQELIPLQSLEGDLRARQDAGEDVATELAAVRDELTDLAAVRAQLEAQRFAIEQQLVELGALDDPVAVARAAATDADRALSDALTAFARGQVAVDKVPFSPTVGLGLADEIRTEVDREALSDPTTWRLDLTMFRGRDGEASALELLGEDRPTQTLVGPHPHCASPPVPAPTGYEDHRRVSVQPTDTTSCIQWWTVDLYVDDGQVTAVTLDLWEP